MDGPQEYEVESITRARVHDKRGKKITWKYYVKWKGYDWDESTWEPTDSFQGGSEHILESFWERIDTGGRDISDATAFKKGEELLISGPPGRKSLKRKANPAKTQTSPSNNVPSSNGVPISAPPLLTRKRRRMQITADDVSVHSQPRRRVSTTDLNDGKPHTRSPKRRRGPSTGLRKSVPKRMPSAGDSQLDADGETDPDVVDVEDELTYVSPGDAEEDNTTRHPAAASASANGSKKISFDDLEHFYSGNPIDIDQNADEQASVPKSEPRSRLQPPSPSPVQPQDEIVPESEAPASPPLTPSDPLFDSPSHPSDEVPEIQRGDLPPHRARTAKPLVKFIDTTTPVTRGKQSRITAKARLMSIHTTDAPSTRALGHVAKHGGKPGPGQSSSVFIAKSRSSLLTTSGGTLKSVKGKFASTTERDQPDEIEEVPAAGGRIEGDKLLVTSWSDDDIAVDHDGPAVSNSQSGPPPSGNELLKLAGLQADMEILPDYEDDSAMQPQDAKTQDSTLALTPVEGKMSNQTLVEAPEGSKTDDHDADALRYLPKVEQKDAIGNNPLVQPVVTPPVDEAVKTNIELAKEHLFPSTQTSFDSFGTSRSSFRSTIFGPLYQGSTASHASVAKNEPLTAFRVILGDGVELSLVLKDCNGIKVRIGDILIGKSSGSKVAVFYSAEDALAMASALKSEGTARVVLDPSMTAQQECFSMFLQRFESSHTLVAPVGKDICVLYSSENADIAQKLEAPVHLRGLSHTILISHASIENQLAYVAAVMQAPAL